MANASGAGLPTIVTEDRIGARWFPLALLRLPAVGDNAAMQSEPVPPPINRQQAAKISDRAQLHSRLAHGARFGERTEMAGE
jgi:hypothetical protein